MPKPTMSDVHVSAPLTNLSTAYIQEADSFVAPMVFPRVPVQKQADKYFVWNKGDMLRLEADERAPGGKVKAIGVGLTTAEYSTRRYATRYDVPDPIRDNSDAAVDLERAATEVISQQLLMKIETVWAANYFATGVWTTEMAGASSADSTHIKYWSSSSTTPIADVKTGMSTVLWLTGRLPNTLVMSYAVFTALCTNSDILDRIKYTQKGIVTEDLLAALFGLDRVIVAKAIKNTANEGATASLSAILGKHALLVHVPKAPGLMVPSPGYTFAWNGYTGAGAAGNRIKKYRLEEIESDVVEGEIAVDMKLVAADLGYFFLNAVA